jgi:hypothetical protein
LVKFHNQFSRYFYYQFSEVGELAEPSQMIHTNRTDGAHQNAGPFWIDLKDSSPDTPA